MAIGSPQEELRRAFRARARRAHPDGGGTAEAFRQLREAYILLRRGRAIGGGLDGAESAAETRARKAAWARWADDVRHCREFASEGDVLYWRVEAGAPWQPGVVLAVQVVEEPSSGPHGWMYLQPLVQEEPGGLFRQDEDAEMEQVEPLSPDGVNWCFASALKAPGEGCWSLGPPPRVT